MAREACLNLLDYVRSDRAGLPDVHRALHLAAAAVICDQYKVGYFDLAGNCRLTFDQVYIRRARLPQISRPET